MDRDKLIEIFRDTSALVGSGEIQHNSMSARYRRPNMPTPRTTLQTHDQGVTINVDTVTAAQHFSRLGKTCILNMASYKHPGGGVERGAMAQEECLFRCSNLFAVVPSEYYPLEEDALIYTNDAVFFKDRHYNRIEPFTCDVVTVAALNLNPTRKLMPGETLHRKFANDEYEIITKNKIRQMFYYASRNGCRYVILGAWGCGVFKNDPIVMSELFWQVMLEWNGAFEKVVFAVINDRNSSGDNFTAFRNRFREEAL